MSVHTLHKAGSDETHVVRSVGVVVDTTKERSRPILANHLRNQVTATRMLIHERRDVVDEASNDDQGALHGLFLDWIETSAMTQIA